jgi:hypothetical protein
MPDLDTTQPDTAPPSRLSVEPHRFAIVPEWLIDADVSDVAFRLYAVLLRYGQSSGCRMPSRATLARRLKKASTDTVDRALRELVALGAVEIERRRSGRQNLPNQYHVRTSRPHPEPAGADPAPPEEGGRTDAANPGGPSGLPDAASRTRAATLGRSSTPTLAAAERPNPEHLTQEYPPPPAARATLPRALPKELDAEQLARLGVHDLRTLEQRCLQLRRDLGKPMTRWSGPCLVMALQLAVLHRGWPADKAPRALLLVAADPATVSPMRVAEAGPWWDAAELSTTGIATPPDDPRELEALEARLADLDGQRVVLQRRARAQLAAEGHPVTRATVIRRAIALLDGPLHGAAS